VNLFDDADDGKELRVRCDSAHVARVAREIEAATDRIHVWPEPVREPLVDDDDGRGLRSVTIVKRAATNEGNPHRFEIPGRCDHLCRREKGFAGLHDVPFRENHVIVRDAAERQRADEPGALDFRPGSDRLERTLRERDK
jgi:hypothetical protein